MTSPIACPDSDIDRSLPRYPQRPTSKFDPIDTAENGIYITIVLEEICCERKLAELHEHQW